MPHDHPHGSSPPHGHGHAPVDVGRAFAIGIALNSLFVVIEAAYGFLSDSLALLADAGHNLSDVAALIVAWGAASLTRARPTPRRTYGFRRSSILASLVNAGLLLIAIGAIAWEAVRRLGAAPEVATGTMIWVAGLGILVNAGTAALFFADRKSDLNIRGAFLHMAADAAISAGVVVAALLIAATGWRWLDPAVSLLIAAIIALGSWRLLSQSLDLALDAVPAGIDPEAVAGYLAALPGVSGVHDLHIWGMSTTETALTVHLIRPDGRTDDRLLAEISHVLHDRFGIAHATLQIETGDETVVCRLAGADVV